MYNLWVASLGRCFLIAAPRVSIKPSGNDGSIGRYPFAPAASGNLITEDLVFMKDSERYRYELMKVIKPPQTAMDAPAIACA